MGNATRDERAANGESEPRWVFFLGGRDLEMETIADLLARPAAGDPPFRVVDRRPSWGARASLYAREIAAALAAGERPALVELKFDLAEADARILEIDHHGDRAGHSSPTSLEQVFALLGRPRSAWTRWLDLVAANDRAHIDGLLDAGATMDEIVEIRRRDRAAQGATAAEEAAARAAALRRRGRAGGRLVVVDLPHDRTGMVADILHAALGGPGYEALLVAGPGEIGLYAPGAVIEAARRRFPGGWRGGDLPRKGFWGIRRRDLGDVDAAAVERAVEEIVASAPGRVTGPGA